ncbi:DUF2254 domain-containing protein [Pseudonocardia broussonetiae]|uniref:DUF2254 domain-containing protein n=1 Tax=Pseudonocardia broussonetiae TaxID=2736640 RepID=A0A6M6JMY4_9PSEU|nr:DUF2254 domain-containing protein [Pseudonocardia broussonetiae]QJY47982.1 DUF2254 domain-containing protein [Pseudonocardia broussonetiae]
MPWSVRFELRQYLKGSLWVLPVLGLLLGVVLAQVALAVDDAVRLPTGWTYSAATASGVLTAIVGAMVALLGFVVTVGVLVVQQATSTLSPRYMRLWYRDRLQKVVLATFAGTLTFAFALLRRIGEDTVPDVGVTTAGVAVAASLGLLMVYLDRFTHDLRPVAVAALVSRSGQEVLARWTAEMCADGSAPRDGAAAAPVPGPTWSLVAQRTGVVQAVNLAALVSAAEEHDCTIVLDRTVGDFVTTGTVLAQVHGAGPPPADHLRHQFAFGRERTIEQDPAFAMRVLVDIATRAVSPAINDPTTAVQVLDYVEDFLEVLARTDLRSRCTLGRGGATRLVIPGPGWEEYLELAVTEVRDYGVTSVQVCRRLRAVLDRILVVVPDERRAAVREELRRLDAAVATAFPEPGGREPAAVGDRHGIGGRVDRPAGPAVARIAAARQ